MTIRGCQLYIQLQRSVEHNTADIYEFREVGRKDPKPVAPLMQHCASVLA